MTLIEKLKLVYDAVTGKPGLFIDYEWQNQRIIELEHLLSAAKIANDDLLNQLSRLNNMVDIEKQELQRTVNLYETQYTRNNVWSHQ